MKSLLVMVLVSGLVLKAFRTDYLKGLAISVGLLVSLPDYLRVSFGGAIPELTIHRLLLLFAAFYWIKFRRANPLPRADFFRGLLVLGAAQLASLLFSVHFSGSAKSFLVFSIEVFLFYVIVSTSLQSREAIMKILFAIGLGLGSVALLAAVEKYGDINVSQRILGDSTEGAGDITATYPHRILLGYAMAMGVPILYALAEREPRKFWRRLLFCASLLMIAGCYFSNSRGPWGALIFGWGVLALFGSRAARRVAMIIVILVTLILLVRPGVRETVWSAVGSIFEHDSLKAKSYDYRWRLWQVAYGEVVKSPERMLFGYGGLSTETMDLSHYFESESGGTTDLIGFTSWDNQFACDLIEFGFVGLAIEVLLLLWVLWTLISLWARCADLDKCIFAAFTAACAIYLYAMTNVYIFSPQIKCLFWVLVACGLRFGQLGNSVRIGNPINKSDETIPYVLA